MSIRLRVVDGHLVALCAARSVPKEGDTYLDDAAHMALARKLWLDYPQCGLAVEPEVVAATDREESNNDNRSDWDRWMAEAEMALGELTDVECDTVIPMAEAA